MNKLLVLLLLFPVAEVAAQRAPDLPAGYCYVDCFGKQPVAPYDFERAARRQGDPNTGRRLGRFVMVPSEEGGPADQRVLTTEWLSELMDVERYAAEQCGRSLNDDSWGDIIDVVAPCGDIDKILESDASVIRQQHKRRGNPPMSDETAERAYRHFTQDEEQAKLQEKLYCRFVPGGGSNHLDSQHCEPFDLRLGAERTLAVGMTSQACRRISAPSFRPESRTVLGGGTLECRRGIPRGTTVQTNGEAKLGIWVFNNEIIFLGAESRQVGALNRDAIHTSRTTYKAQTSCRERLTGDQVEVDENCVVSRKEEGAAATFMVGPIPITVQAGAYIETGTSDFAKVAPMWANGRVGPYVDSAGFASAFINLLIVRAGVEAGLTFFNDKYFLTSFAAVAHLSEGSGIAREGFYFSEQLNGVNQLNALAGRIDAFASIPVPKWLGIRWKKFRLNIFNWSGIRATGYVIDHQQGPVDLTRLQ